nr:Gfo/Idh/MocA family oxidoreductase [Cucumibacter marinus]
MTTKIALVGVGKIARDQHVPALSASPDFELVATASLEGAVEGVPGFQSLDALFAAHPEVTAVSICIPPVPRFEVAAQALRSGRHVMLEKPPGASVSECRELEAMAKQADLSIYATWHSREAAQVANARAWLRNKRLTSLTITWKEDVRRWHPGQTWIWKSGGLGVFDPGINALSILTEILPVPVHMRAATLFVPENCDTPIAADLTFAHPDGAAVSADFDFRQEGEQTWSMDIRTTEGDLVLSDGGARLAIDGETLASDAVLHETADEGGEDKAPLGGEYHRLYANFARLLASGETDMDLSPLLHVADAFMLGRRVSVEPFIE